MEKVVRLINKVLMWIAACSLVTMILLTCANIFLRKVWIPVAGTFELMGYIGAVATAFALGYAQMGRAHIAVDVLVLRFSKKTRRILNATNCSICTIFFGIVSWQIARYATTLWKTGEVTETLRIVYYPFIYGVALGCAILSLVFLSELFKSLSPEKEDEK